MRMSLEPSGRWYLPFAGAGSVAKRIIYIHTIHNVLARVGIRARYRCVDSRTLMTSAANDMAVSFLPSVTYDGDTPEVCLIRVTARLVTLSCRLTSRPVMF